MIREFALKDFIKNQIPQTSNQYVYEIDKEGYGNRHNSKQDGMTCNNNFYNRRKRLTANG